MKQKTRKSVTKKVKVTKSGKVIRRTTKQNHYNLRETKDSKRAKRRDITMTGKDAKNIKAALPYA
ncbi:MAG: 50S ribosomal protein L35 [Candidatus Moraniibacteriota bacterium]|nr:MAG: 50S ribosomal protein L35 [Candidatus Moranbacteria bacterium]